MWLNFFIWFVFFLAGALFAAGYTAYRKNHKRRRSRPRPVPYGSDYFVGLNYLIDNEPDSAVDTFIETLEENATNLDSYLALGTLLRRRGRVNKAISIYQHLLSQSEHSRKDEGLIKIELAKSYITAGLLDRVEKLVEELVNRSSGVRLQALELSVSLYQLEKDWSQGVIVLQELLTVCPVSDRKKYQLMLSHFYCELADMENHQGRTAKAKDLLIRAGRVSRENVRVNLMLADLYMKAGDARAAVKVLQQTRDIDPVYNSEIYPLLVRCLHEVDEKKLDRFLRDMLSQEIRDDGVLLSLAELYIEKEGTEKGLQYVLDRMSQSRTLELADKALFLLVETTEGEQQEIYRSLSRVVTAYLAGKSTYVCVDCGFKGKTLHWNCPGCNRWGSVKPLHSLEQDAEIHNV